MPSKPLIWAAVFALALMVQLVLERALLVDSIGIAYSVLCAAVYTALAWGIARGLNRARTQKRNRD